MTSRTTPQFRALFASLTADVQDQARKAYAQFKRDPWHAGLRFKRVHPVLPIYSARIGRGFRAVGRRDHAGILWFWIGSHPDYEALLRRQ